MPLILADQLVAHAVGDYLLQSDWMAQEKTRRVWPAAVHALVYTLCFFPLLMQMAHNPRWAATVICVTHFAIDHLRLARFVVYAKNFLGAPSYWRPWRKCRATGYPEDRPPWLAVWLLIIADNVLHVLINALALRYL